jgi:hypothetical protein
MCGLSVHMDCVGEDKTPDGSMWLCDLCKLKEVRKALDAGEDAGEDAGDEVVVRVVALLSLLLLLLLLLLFLLLLLLLLRCTFFLDPFHILGSIPNRPQSQISIVCIMSSRWRAHETHN